MTLTSSELSMFFETGAMISGKAQRGPAFGEIVVPDFFLFRGAMCYSLRLKTRHMFGNLTNLRLYESTSLGFSG